jgi:hypothetical protein
MQTKEKTKMLGGTQEFFFPGSMEYEPKTIEAESFEEAQEIWEEEKQKVELPKTNQTENIWQKESEDSSK